jgi:hypothetical protein
MFETSLSSLILWNLLLLVGGLAGIWTYAVIRQKYLELRSKQKRFQCAICGNLYYDEDGGPLVPCPLCGRQNERGEIMEL